jgi:hypothetical protein
MKPEDFPADVLHQHQVLGQGSYARGRVGLTIGHHPWASEKQSQDSGCRQKLHPTPKQCPYFQRKFSQKKWLPCALVHISEHDKAMSVLTKSICHLPKATVTP